MESKEIEAKWTQSADGVAPVICKSKFCGRSFTNASILKHLRYESCKSSYSEAEIQEFRNQSIERKRNQKRKLYDPAERRIRH